MLSSGDCFHALCPRLKYVPQFRVELPYLGILPVRHPILPTLLDPIPLRSFFQVKPPKLPCRRLVRDMAFKVPRLPAKRRLSSSTDAPSISPSIPQPSSSLSYSSPTSRAVARPHKRVGLVPRSLGANSAASLSAPRDPDVFQQSSTPVHARIIQEQDGDEVEEDESLAERIMAVDMRNRGDIGCCYYVAQHEALYLLEDIRSAGLETIDLRGHIQFLVASRLVNEV